LSKICASKSCAQIIHRLPPYTCRERQGVAAVNVRVEEEMKRKLAELAKSAGATQSELVKSTIAEKIAVHQTARLVSPTTIPDWVPKGKYVALVRGAVAAVGDSVAEVVASALDKFSEEPVHVARKGRPIERVNYAFLVSAATKCWKYLTVNQDSYPVIPTTIMGKNRLRIASSPDTAANLTLVDGHIVDQAHLQPAGQVGIFTAAGPVKAKTFTAEIELPTGSFKTIVASSSIPKALPFQAVLGGNLLDNVDLYALGKSKVVCISDP